MESSAYDASTIRLVDNTGYRPTLGSDYVLLGMVDDYLDRSADRHDDVVERFYPREKVIAQLFVRYASGMQPSTSADAVPIVRTTSAGHIEVVSEPTKARVDAFYLPPEPGTPWEGRTAMKLPTSVFPTITSRQYRPSEMDPRFSYLYGAYLRYGCDEPFQFRLANSSGRVELIKQLLVDVNAKWASHKFTINTAPVAHDIAFEPDLTLATIIRSALEERNALRRELGEGCR